MADDLDARIGRNLRDIRLKAGLSVDALAGWAGLQPVVIERYEAGRQRVPVAVLTHLAELLKHPLGAFFA